MSRFHGVENDLRDLRSSCKFYEAQVKKFPKEDLELCESFRDDATEMLCDLGSVEAKLEILRSRASRTRTDILRVLNQMDGAIEAKQEKKKPTKKRKPAPRKPAAKAAPEKPAPKAAAAPPARKKARSAGK